jgi:acetyl-CoA carboxylase biotin carboxyl carrier protein
MASKFDIDAVMVRKLAELLTETGLNEIEYAEGERRIRLHRAPPAPLMQPMPMGMMSGATMPSSATTAGIATQPPTVEAVSDAHNNMIISPMVGTVYLSAEPNGKPFIKIGDTVKLGDTLLIIEAMKVMNPIKATAGGVIKDILVRDGKPVEFGEALLVLA